MKKKWYVYSDYWDSILTDKSVFINPITHETDKATHQFDTFTEAKSCLLFILRSDRDEYNLAIKQALKVKKSDFNEDDE